MPIHVVQPGDTLWKIAQTNGVPVSRLSELNGLKNGAIVPGLALYIPDTMPERFYRVKPNDRLWQIGSRFGLTLPAILNSNPGLTPNNISAGQTLLLPSPIKYNLQTLAFLDATSFSSAISTQLQALSNYLSYVAVFAYTVQADGSLLSIPDQAILNNMNALNIKALMVITNAPGGEFSPDLADQVLNSTIRPSFIQSILQTIQQKGYSGVSLDFEFIPASRRSDYSAFLRELKMALGSLILHVNAPSKTHEILNNPIVGAVDYKALGESADIVTILTYDYGYPTGPPDPIAPAWWVSQVLNYALTLIPKNRLMIGIPLYGYDWNIETFQTEALSAKLAQNQALDWYSPVNYSNENESPFYSYTTGTINHTVWFEDIRSLRAKYRVLETYEILGAAFWQLTFDFPQSWEYLKANLTVLK